MRGVVRIMAAALFGDENAERRYAGELIKIAVKAARGEYGVRSPATPSNGIKRASARGNLEALGHGIRLCNGRRLRE